eukprot:1930340-Alexandrium_andersonii.AAC.1
MPSTSRGVGRIALKGQGNTHGDGRFRITQSGAMLRGGGGGGGGARWECPGGRECAGGWKAVL